MAAMNPEVKEKWLAALRSGKYKQTIRGLHTQDGFCCLGVLTDLYIKEKGLQWDIVGDPLEQYFNGNNAVLSFEVCDWAGLKNGDPVVTLTPEEADVFDFHKRRMTLSSLNDNGTDFESISNVIEKHL